MSNTSARDILLDHYKRPRNRGTLPQPVLTSRASNPLCGDEVALFVLLSPQAESLEPSVEDIRFEGKGCSMLLASASMLTEQVRGRPVTEVRAAIRELVRNLRTPGWTSAAVDRDVDALQDVKLYPARITCALMPWTTLEALLTSAA